MNEHNALNEDRMPETDWIEEFLPLHEKAKPLVQAVGKSAKQTQEENIIRILKEAKANMPTILKCNESNTKT